MTLNPRLVAEIIRQRLGLPDDSMATRIILQIPACLKATGRKIAASPDLRQLLITDPSSTSAAIGSGGVVDLTTPYSSFRFLMEYFDLGLVYLLPSTTVTPYQINPTRASGTWTFLGQPIAGETIDVNGVTFTFTYPNILTAGAGDAGVNTTYVYNGTYNGRRFYNPGIQSVDPLAFSLVYGVEGPGWFYTDINGDILYHNGGEDVATPDLSGRWYAQTGAAPAPTSVTPVALTTPSVEIGDTLAESATNFEAALTASVNALITVATYAASANQVVGTYGATGAGGNAFTMAVSDGGAVAVSGATFAGGAATVYRLSAENDLPGIADLTRVRFTTTVTLPTGIASSSTDYYITDYEAAVTGDRATASSFTISAYSDGSVPNPITAPGSGVLTMTLMDITNPPLQRLRSPQQAGLTRYLDDVFTYFYIQGNELFVLPKTIEGSVAFAAPSYPTNLAAMPESEEAERIFLDKLYELVLPAVNDAAQDGEK